MLEIVFFSFLGWLSDINSPTTKTVTPLELFPWHEAMIFQLPDDESHLMAQRVVDEYLENLQQRGFDKNLQGIWLQSDWTELGSYRGRVAVSAASLTKIATTLAVLGKLGLEHRFTTKIYHTGSIREGVLTGDLIVLGDRDPFFVWEEAIALSNALNQLGIQEVTGDLLVDNHFYMNYQTDPLASARLLKQGLVPSLWSKEVQQQFQTLPITTSRPQLTIRGEAKIISELPQRPQLLVTHQSLPLVDILRQMNIYSNNYMAQMLADIVGGADKVAEYTRQTIDVAPSEIQLINGSGLGVENRISPRAVTKMLMEIERILKPHDVEVRDIFPVAGRDELGTMTNRQLPNGVGVKTGTLDRVSALAGVIPLNNDDNRVWFAAINNGGQIELFRQQQDRLLQKLVSLWNSDPDFAPIYPHKIEVYLGDPQRNQINNK